MTSKENSYLFFCMTQMQLVTCLNILDQKLTEGERFNADLIIGLSNRKGIANLKHCCEKIRLFRNIRELDNIDDYNIKRLANLKKYKHLSLVNFALGTFGILRPYLQKKLFQTIDLPFNTYSDVYFHNHNDALIELLNERCQIHIIDEGVSSYTVKPKTQNIQYLHLYEPGLLQFEIDSNIHIIQLQKIDLVRTRLTKWLSSLFQDVNKHNYENIVFLDQDLGDSKNKDIFETKKRLLLQIRNKFKDDEMEFCPHPGTSPAVLDSYKKIFSASKKQGSTSTPCEISWFLSGRIPKEIHSIHSSGAFYWLFMFNTEKTHFDSNVFLYWNCFITNLRSPFPNQDKISSFLNKLKSSFPKSINLM